MNADSLQSNHFMSVLQPKKNELSKSNALLFGIQKKKIENPQWKILKINGIMCCVMKIFSA